MEHNLVRKRALALLAEGCWTPSDVAALCEVSTQVVCNWVRRAGLDWKRMRAARLRKDWNRICLKDVGLTDVRMTKRRMRRMAKKAKDDWDRTQAERQAHVPPLRSAPQAQSGLERATAAPPKANGHG